MSSPLPPGQSDFNGLVNHHLSSNHRFDERGFWDVSLKNIVPGRVTQVAPV